jgi:hypothetical protein
MKVKIADMVVDEKYQRPLSEKFVQKIVDNFDEKQFGVIVCNLRWNGEYAVVDGQHRLEAATRRGRKQLDTVVFEIDATEEGKLFSALQANRRAASPIETHKALVFSKDPDAVALDRVVRNNGFRVATDSISAVGRMRQQISRGWTLKNLDKALKVVAGTWGTTNKNALKMEIVMGLWMFFERADLRATTDGAVDAFLDLDPRVVTREAKGIDTEMPNVGLIGAAGIVFADRYNKYHRLRGVSKIDRMLFTASFRSKLGHRERPEQPRENTGQFGSNRSEYNSPFSTGESE